MITSQRSALSRLELVFVIALLLVVVGIFVNFITRHREEANRVHCLDNLRRIGEATLLFHQDRKFLPAARIAPGHATWAVQIAPYLAKDSPLLEWDFRKDFVSQTDKVRETPLTVFFCPTRRRSTPLSTPG